MTTELCAIIGTGLGASVIICVWIGDATTRLERKLDILIEEVRYPNREAQKRDLMGQEAHDSMNEML